MMFALATLALAQAAIAAAPAGDPPAARSSARGQPSVGVSVSASARILAPVRLVRDGQTGAVTVKGKAAPAPARRDEAGVVWIEFS